MENEILDNGFVTEVAEGIEESTDNVLVKGIVIGGAVGIAAGVALAKPIGKGIKWIGSKLHRAPKAVEEVEVEEIEE